MPKLKIGIKNDKWYIVDTLHRNIRYKLEPILLDKEFDKKEQAIRQLPLFKDKMRYDVVFGEMAIYYKLRFTTKIKRLGFRLVKYNYNEESTTFRERKSFRHKARRHAKQKSSNRNTNER